MPAPGRNGGPRGPRRPGGPPPPGGGGPRLADRLPSSRGGRALLVLGALAAIAFLTGVAWGASYEPPEQAAAQEFADAWARNDFRAMYDSLTEEARAEVSFSAFRNAYRGTAATATADGVSVGSAGDPSDGVVPVPVTVKTRLWGDVTQTLDVPVDASTEPARIIWSRELTFPGRGEGEDLVRDTRLGRRGTILARNGEPFDEVGGVGDLGGIVGELGPAEPAQRARLDALGYPPDAQVGISGLQRVFNDDLAGTPGGTLRIGSRVLGRSEPTDGRSVRSTLDPEIQAAAVSALGSYSGGIAVGDPSTGEVLALAGQAFSILQPPGSVFKIITATAALEDKKVTPREEFPVETGHSIEGYFLPNANGEACGGTFINSIAHSCNSVFGPLGVEVGAERLVQTAERYGFNRPIGIPGAETSLIPPANQITSDLQVGTSAIGQDKVQTTPLEMMTVGGTIAMNGKRARPTLRAGAEPKLDTVTTPEVARVIKQGMAGVVQYGTAKDSGQIPGIAYAGKTGTAELGEGIESDAWFVAFAPLQRPKIAVGVLLLQAGFGGKVAAPVAAQLIEQVLR